ncbi:uncharacterized protein F4807DRAFT_457067 [Annulohypoxylon truncatum]|uniref:uncharacterized protein n=1 Tax=Annulohypoxylon truncatum TaxID=327061 RepID=UPI0020084FF8|nr:uncharacterized protein F4807DRAFT_457067 [Annulohypoxylon truncatum]KAI1212982.1 hypothetical protein F4807DRAFT_457067 [Annulohypoxylon truncatum]
MGAHPKSPKPEDTRDPKTKQRSSSSSYYPSTSTSKTTTSPNHHKSTTRDTEIPARKPATAATGKQVNGSTTSTSPQSDYQNSGPGFTQTVKNIPGVGLVYNDNQSNPNPVHGVNPASGPQPHLGHQIPGAASPQVLPPGFVQKQPQVVPQFAFPASQQQAPVMAYASFMPNQGQHFQPPVPDTTYGPIPHTYHPRFDNNNVAAGQYVSIDGHLYQVVGTSNAHDGAPAAVQYVPVQQVSAILTQDAPMVVPIASGVAGNPIVLQQQQGGQAPVFIQGQPGVHIAQPAPVATQPGAFPPMVGAPQAVGASGMPGAFPASSAPDVMGIGKTGMEVQLEQYHTAVNNKALEGQDIAPADPDPSRMYYCRELDGEWTLRNRFGIDNMGDCRWYVLPGGIFYAVRLAD